MADIVVLQESLHGVSAAECVERLRERAPEYEVAHAVAPSRQRALIGDAKIAVGGRFRDELLDRAENLRLFACSWAGVDHLDLEEMAARDIAVTNASGVHGPNIAEHVIGWFLLLTRRFEHAMRQQERAEWRHFQAMGELNDSTVAVVGLGAIGEAIVERLAGFNVETVGIRYTPSKGGPTDEVYGYDAIPDVFADVDYVAIAAPLTEETDGLFDRRAFDTLPTSAILVNVGRGPIVDTDDLLYALRTNRIHAAGLDVTDPEPLPPDHPLWGMSNVLITPHNAGHTPAYWIRVADILIRNLERIEETGAYQGLENQVV